MPFCETLHSILRTSLGEQMDYLYENLGPERFQQFCQALLAREYPKLQCFPVAQPDGGRDAISYFLRKGSKTFRLNR